MYKALIVDDEEGILFSVKSYFANNGFEVATASNLDEAYTHIYSRSFDLYIFDVMLPDGNGFSFCEKLKSHGDTTPVVFLTAKVAEEDQLKGFGIGADDYVVKPFSLAVLLKRCTLIIERAKGIRSKGIIKSGDIIIDTISGDVFVDGKKIILTHRELEVLKYFIEKKNTVLSRDKILDRIWGYDFYGDPRIVDTYIKSLRKHLAESNNTIKTIVKEGYKYEEFAE